MSTSLVPAGAALPPRYDPEGDIVRKQRLAVLAVSVLVLGFGGLATFVPIGGAVVAGGQVSAESLVKRVTHPLGGVISEIRVKLGDRVRKGDILIRLDSTVTRPDAELTALSVDQLLAQQARLNAERLGLSRIEFPTSLINNPSPDAQRAIAQERDLFVLRRSEADGMRAELQSRMLQGQQAIVGHRAQITALEQQLKLIEPERAGLQQLWKKQLVTINRVNQIERSASDMQGSIGALRAQIAETYAQISEAREQMIRLTATRRSDAGTQLASVNAALNQQQSRKASAGDAFERGTIRAPQDGIVDKLVFSTIGEVIRPAEPIMEIVPDRDRMLVDAAVNPNDIDQVRPGQRARIRFTAFNSTSTPEITGSVAVVAPDRTTDAKSERSYYSVRIIPDLASIKAASGMHLAPGMPAEVFIETGSRSMLSYITKPLRDQFARSFRDN